VKTYVLQFGTDNPANYTGFSPTFTIFQSLPGNSFAPVAPSIIEAIPTSGIYSFGWTATTFPVAFKVDGGASLIPTSRYLVGLLDPIQAVDEKIGWLTDSFGSTATDPTSVLGYVKRLQEFNEGVGNFNATSGTWVVQSRSLVAGVTTTPATLVTHLLSNNSGSVTKS
jgi:hypothetical protein